MQTKKLYALGLVLAEECPANDCKVFLNIFNMARSLDDAIDEMDDPNSYPAIVLRQDLHKRLRELGEMYFENCAVQKFKEERAFMGELRRELLRQKRAVGNPRAPMRARPGQEEAFEKVETNLARADFILKFLEMEALRKAKRKAVRTADALLDGFIVFGLASAAMLGVAAAAVLLNAPSPVVQATAIIGVGVALARAVARK